MAVGCINRNSPEYQRLKKVSGIPEIQLDTICMQYLEEFNRFPRLDELENSNSSNYIKETLKLDKNNSTSIDNILDKTNTNSVEDATIELNSQYPDVEIQLLSIADKVQVNIKPRPTTDYIEDIVPNNIDIIDNQTMIVKALNKLASLYGIKVHQISEEDLALDKWNGIINRDKYTKAFIYNGEIYINIDRYSPDSFVHEMLHLLVGSMRFTNPELYFSMISQIEQIPTYNDELKKYDGKTRNDANEEIFVSELAKHLTGQSSKLQDLTNEQLYEIKYNVYRVLDSMLMGDYSTKIIDNIFEKTLKQIVQATNSDILTSQYQMFGASVHRQLNNMKQDLLSKGELTEICD